MSLPFSSVLDPGSSPPKPSARLRQLKKEIRVRAFIYGMIARVNGRGLGHFVVPILSYSVLGVEHAPMTDVKVGELDWSSPGRLRCRQFHSTSCSTRARSREGIGTLDLNITG